MGTPAPYTNLLGNKDTTPNETSLGRVTSIDSDGKHATVEVAGTTWTVSVPGSVYGVAVGRSVYVRTVGNIRRVDALATVIPKVTYRTSDQGQRSVDTPLAGTGGGTPSYPGSQVPSNSFNPYIPGFTVADASSNSTAEINKSRLYIGRLVTRFTNDTSTALSSIRQQLGWLVQASRDNRSSILSARSAVADNSRSINDLRQNVDELRKVVETLSSDLREQGLVK